MSACSKASALVRACRDLANALVDFEICNFFPEMDALSSGVVIRRFFLVPSQSFHYILPSWRHERISTLCFTLLPVSW